jgi:gamma-D-glutamyl-L-lysine dipeptidyl-peptidase
MYFWQNSNMEQIICPLAIIPIRREPNHRSEQISQLLFGEKAIIHQLQNGWLYIETLFDHYYGWIDEYVTEIVQDMSSKQSDFIVKEPFISIRYKNTVMHLPAGSEVSKSMESSMLTLSGERLILKEKLKQESDSIIETSIKFLKSPYLWGGRTCFGIDCSGFAQIVFKIHGVALPRDARDQALTGRKISTMKEAERNDLIFFGESDEQISHVGIFMGKNQIIHASKSVRIDQVDEKGIYNSELSRYTHKFQSIRRFA